MAHILQIDFPFPGPFGEQMAEALHDLALSITREPGFIWKIWTEDEDSNEAGGIYLFETKKAAVAYLAKHTTRLKELGVIDVNGKIFAVNETLSQLTHAPLR
jgi:hypothetical protein